MTKLRCLMLASAAAVMLGGAMVIGHAQTPQHLTQVEKAAEALEINNMMGRYAAYVIANHWDDIGAMFALDDPDVHQNVPFQMQGPAVRDYFTKRAAEKLPDGVMHQHTFLSPIIEVAGDGQTAKGVWDSPGIDTGNGNAMANWAWVRYAIDFKKINGEWKIWHLSVLPVWTAPYGDSWSTMVAKASGGKMTGGGPGTPVAAPAAAGKPPAGPMPKSAPKWRYSGVGATPLLPAKLPVPYETFDPKDAY
jgi:hypothetical protein